MAATPPFWHSVAVGGRPPHHPLRTSGKSLDPQPLEGFPVDANKTTASTHAMTDDEMLKLMFEQLQETLELTRETRQMMQECIDKAQEMNRQSEEILRAWQQPVFQVGLDQ
jgi:hypothetical protein